VYPFPSSNLSLAQVLLNYNIQGGSSFSSMNELRTLYYWDSAGTMFQIPPTGNFSLSSLFGKYSYDPSSFSIYYTSPTNIVIPGLRPPPKRFDISLIGGGGGGGGGAGGYSCAGDNRTGGGGGGGSSGVIFSASSINYIGNLFGPITYGNAGGLGGGGGGVGCPPNPAAGNQAGGGGNGNPGGTTSVSYNGVTYSAAGGNGGGGGGPAGYNGGAGSSYEGSRGGAGVSAGSGSVAGTQGTGFVQNPGNGGISPSPFGIYGNGGNAGGGSVGGGSGGSNGVAGILIITWYFI
jgi:hypothetical protein